MAEWVAAQRFYVWFSDSAPPGAIEEFGATVIAGSSA